MTEGQRAGCVQTVVFAEHHPKNAAAAIYAAESILHRPGGEPELGKAGLLLKRAIAADPRQPDVYYQMEILDHQ